MEKQLQWGVMPTPSVCGMSLQRKLYRIKGHTGDVNSLVFSPDGRTLATGSRDDTIGLWDVSTGATGENLHTLIGHTTYLGQDFPVNTVVFSPDGKTIASGGTDLTLRLWDVATGTEKRTLTGYTTAVNTVAFSPDGTTSNGELGRSG